MKINVIKRDNHKVDFDAKKIAVAIEKANKEVEQEEGKATQEEIQSIIDYILTIMRDENSDTITVEAIQDIIERKLSDFGKFELSKKYILYRYNRSLVRKQNTTDDSILKLVQYDNKDVMDENSNKDPHVASTQRDLVAGEVSKDLTKRVLLPKYIVDAHERGEIHFHDMDYYLQSIFNCCLIDIKDMLDNGTCINGKMVESPKSFQVACTVMTQIIAVVASSQYGGQSVNIKHLGKYLRRSKNKFRKRIKEASPSLTDQQVEEQVNMRIKEELSAGVQTIQYQLNTIATSNGQTPFVTIFLDIDDSDEYVEEVADIVEEILKQRILGLKNEKGVYITPTFPKLIYLLDENNNLSGGKYDYITKLAGECSAKRMYPDYISAKIMRQNYEGETFSCMGCRSFLSPWKDENGNYKWEGRFNQGVVSINLPQIAILADGDMDKFWKLFDERLDLCKEALLCRHKHLLGTTSDIAPIHWQYGAIARLDKGEKIDKYLVGGYSTLSLGYIGIYEMTKLMTGESQTTEKGREFAIKVMEYMRDACKKWKRIYNLGFALYGTPAESLCYRFAEIDRQRFGDIKDVTDKGYYTNSYHVDVREEIDAFSKLSLEAPFQNISTGGCISYIEIPNMKKNMEVIYDLIRYIYDNIEYAEFNTKSDYCMNCGWDGEIIINDDNEWECPQCGNKDHSRMNVTRRTCGYLGSNFWNIGKTKEIKSRVLHL